MAREISNSEDCLDVRDIIERFEELETEIDDAYAEYKEAKEEIEEEALYRQPWLDIEHDENSPIAVAHDEYKLLGELLESLKGYGGDHQWKGDWYPVGLIRDSYFVEAMQELVSDIGDLPKDIPDYLAIDWERTADNLRVDYGSVEFDGVTYWYR